MLKIDLSAARKIMDGYGGLSQNRRCDHAEDLARLVLLFFHYRRRKKNVKRVNPRGFRDKLLIPTPLHTKVFSRSEGAAREWFLKI
jgi:hypothetical protein